ncbi:MAG: oligosaccharide flippase family protein [Burkholderiales bacterium]
MIQNLLYLYLFQVGQYLFPLIITPYVIRTLSLAGYGEYTVSQSVISMFNVFVDFGFGVVLIRKIGLNLNNKAVINQTFSNVFYAKMLLAIIIFCLILGLFWQSKSLLIYLASFGIILNNIFFPIWFFQAVEQMKFITYINFISRLIFLITVFLFIKHQDDAGLLCLFNSISLVISGLIALFIVRYHFKVKFTPFSLALIFDEIKAAGNVFITNLTGNLFIWTPTLVLGYFSTKPIVGMYSIAEKVSRIMVSFISPVAQVIFPHLSKLAQSDNFIKQANKLILSTAGVGLVISITLFLFSPQIYFLISGKVEMIGVYCLRTWAITFFFIFVANVVNQIVWALHFDKQIRNMCIVASLVFVLLAVCLTYWFSYKGTCFSILVIESITVIYSTGLYLKHVLRNKKGKSICSG